MNFNIFSTMTAAKSGMNFSNLSAEGLSAFVIAIVFSIASIGCFIYFAKHQHMNKIMIILTTMVFPFIAVFSWVYLLLNIFAYPLLTSLGIAFACAVAYLIIAITISTICNNVSKSNEKERAYKELHSAPAESKKVEEKKEEKEEKIEKPLLITHTAEEVQVEEESQVETIETIEEDATVEEEKEEEISQEVITAIATAVALNDEEDEEDDIKKNFNETIETEKTEEEQEEIEEVEDVEESQEEEIDEEEAFNKELETVLAIIKDNNFGEPATEETTTENVEETSQEVEEELEETTETEAVEESIEEVQDETVEEVESVETETPAEELKEDEDWKKYDPTALLFDDEDIELLAPFEDEE